MLGDALRNLTCWWGWTASIWVGRGAFRVGRSAPLFQGSGWEWFGKAFESIDKNDDAALFPPQFYRKIAIKLGGVSRLCVCEKTS